MPIISDTLTPELERIRDALKKLKSMKIHVGIQGGTATGLDKGKAIAVDTPATLLTIAGVHEYGMTIKAKNVKNLTIPISPKAKGKHAGDFNDLFVFTAESGERFLAREKGPDGIELLFWLTPSVTIPERSFIRGSYDSGKGKLEDACKGAIIGILRDGWTAQQAAEHIGICAVGMTKEYFTSGNLKEKGNAALAADARKTTPLIDSGRLRNSITFMIEGG